MTCTICGKERNLDDAHVKPASEFEDDEDDEHRNIIKMCKNHHDMFDNGNIGICPENRKFVVKKDDDIVTKQPESPIGHVKREYVEFKNSDCSYQIRLALGMINSQPWNNVCEEEGD